MQFQVPQYIEVEDKLVGPLSFKQFIYLAGAGGVSYIIFKKTSLILGIPLIAVVVGFALLLTFYPREKFGKPFIEILQSGFKYFTHSRLYTWKRVAPKVVGNKQQMTDGGQTRGPIMPVPTVSEGKLKNLSWNIDVAGDKNESTTDHELPTTDGREKI